MNLKDSNNPAVLEAIRNVVKQSQEKVVAEQQKQAQAATSKYNGFKPITEAEHVMPYSGTKKTTHPSERYKQIMKHAKAQGYNVHHNEFYSDEKSGNKGKPDITIHYERGDDRHSASPASIEIHKGPASKDKALAAMVKGKASALGEENITEELKGNQHKIDKNKNGKIDAHDFKLLKDKKEAEVKENKDTPGNGYEHQCAIHVKHSKLGEGRTLFSQHAEPDAQGQIAWYDVMFEHGIEKKVPVSDLEVLVSESHGNHKKK